MHILRVVYRGSRIICKYTGKVSVDFGRTVRTPHPATTGPTVMKQKQEEEINNNASSPSSPGVYTAVCTTLLQLSVPRSLRHL